MNVYPLFSLQTIFEEKHCKIEEKANCPSEEESIHSLQRDFLELSFLERTKRLNIKLNGECELKLFYRDDEGIQAINEIILIAKNVRE